MKQFTLALAATLCAGYAVAADLGDATDASTYVTPQVSSTSAPKYYKIVNDRTLDFNYDTKNKAENAGTFVTRPWIGLSFNRPAVSLDESVVPTETMYWYFDGSSLDGGVCIRNLANTVEAPTLGWYDTGKGTNKSVEMNEAATTYYIIDLSTYSDSKGNFAANSFAISATTTATGDRCVDVNNYYGVKTTAGGDVINTSISSDKAAYMVTCWNPTDDNTGNLNNGSLFYFIEATDAEIADAKAALGLGEPRKYYDDTTVAFADDENGVVPSISTITLTFPGIEDLSTITPIDADAQITLTKGNYIVASWTQDDFNITDGAWVLTTNEPITEDGTYVFTVPDSFLGILADDQTVDTYFRGVTKSIKLEAPVLPFEVTVTPSEGYLDSLTEIDFQHIVNVAEKSTTFYVTGAAGLNLTLTDGTNAIFSYNGDELADQFENYPNPGYTISGLDITAEGTYTLTIPEGYFEDGKAQNSATTVEYIIGDTGITSITVTTDGTTCVYDLQGRPATTSTRGIVIANGQKQLR